MQNMVAYRMVTLLLRFLRRKREEVTSYSKLQFHLNVACCMSVITNCMALTRHVRGLHKVLMSFPQLSIIQIVYM